MPSQPAKTSAVLITVTASKKEIKSTGLLDFFHRSGLKD
jgi:hypothetical protein